MSEQLQKLIPKQRQRTYEHNTPYPVPPVEVKISDELINDMLESIDAATEDTAA